MSKEVKKLESDNVDNVKFSNFNYRKLMYQKACQVAFSMLVLVLQLKTSFMRFKLSKQVGLTAL